MSKVICDICGTEYPEMEDFCPNCGCSQDVKADMDMELEEDDFLLDSPFTAAKKQKESAAQAEQEESEEEVNEETPEEEEEQEEEESRSSGVGLTILLTILIMLLLGAAGFLFLRYMLPNMELGKLHQEMNPGLQEEVPDQTTDPAIPCRMLALTSGGAVELTREGEYKLIHVIVKPEDTTDELIYTSSNDDIVTVTEDGRLTAISEGEATITIQCGSHTLQCTVNVGFEAETEPPTQEPVQPTEAEPDSEETEPEQTQEPVTETEPEQTEASTEETQEETTGETLKDVTLKLGKSEFILPPGYTYTVPLDCDLTYEEIEWSIEHPHVATVENGVVSGLSTGVTILTAKYGDQEVTCVVRIKRI